MTEQGERFVDGQSRDGFDGHGRWRHRAGTVWKRVLLGAGTVLALALLPPSYAQDGEEPANAQPAEDAPIAQVVEDPSDEQIAENPEIAAAMREAIARLELTEEQLAELSPIFEAHLEKQLAVLEEHGALSGERGSSRRSALENAQDMGKKLNRNNRRFEKQASRILSEEQMAELRRLQEEGRETFRERAVAVRMEQIGETLELTDEQVAAATPVLANHLEAQLAVFEKHDVELGSRERAGLRKLLAIRKETNAVNARTLRLLSNILNEEQLAEYKTIQDEQRRKVRDRLQ